MPPSSVVTRPSPGPTISISSNPPEGDRSAGNLPADGLTGRLADDLDAAFPALVLAYQDRLFTFAVRLSGSRMDAEEIAQDAFVRAYGALRRYDHEQVRTLALTTWLYRIALNVFRNRHRKPRLPQAPLEGEDGATIEPPDREEERPEPRALQAETARTLAGALTAMPARYRAAVVLRHVQDLSYEEAAAILEQPVGTVKANVHRGLHWLRDNASLTETLSEVR